MVAGSPLHPSQRVARFQLEVNKEAESCEKCNCGSTCGGVVRCTGVGMILWASLALTQLGLVFMCVSASAPDMVAFP